jgi:hypothetical protein
MNARTVASALILTAAVLVVLGCGGREADLSPGERQLRKVVASVSRPFTSTPPEGYRVTAYDSRVHEWTIIRTGTFDGVFMTKKFVVVCVTFMNEAGIYTAGPYACPLQVGQFKQVRINFQDGDAPLEDIDQFSDTLMFTEGTSNRPTKQIFDIKRIELLDHRP